MERFTTNIDSHMSGAYQAKKTVFVPLSKLRPHPQQAMLFPDLPEAELKALAEDMQANGQIQPIEILPDGTIVCGHQRVAAARRLGWKTIRCWVREDLATSDAIEQRLIEDNLNRNRDRP